MADAAQNEILTNSDSNNPNKDKQTILALARSKQKYTLGFNNKLYKTLSKIRESNK